MVYIINVVGWHATRPQWGVSEENLMMLSLLVEEDYI